MLSTIFYSVIQNSVSFGQVDTIKDSIQRFKLKTFDDLELHGQILQPAIDINKSHRFIVFIQGGTPYDEKGNTAVECDSLEML